MGSIVLIITVTHHMLESQMCVNPQMKIVPDKFVTCSCFNMFSRNYSAQLFHEITSSFLLINVYICVRFSLQYEQVESVVRLRN